MYNLGGFLKINLQLKIMENYYENSVLIVTYFPYIYKLGMRLYIK